MFGETLSSDNGCYVWSPDADTEHLKPNKKRRKTAKVHHDSATCDFLNTVPLLKGEEAQGYVQKRAALFDSVWQPQQELIDKISKKSNTGTVDDITDFVQQASRSSSEAIIPSALVIVGPNSSPFTSIAQAVALRLRREDKAIVISTTPSEITNLKAALKLINSYATTSSSRSGNSDGPRRDQYGRHLNYDLQILCDHVNNHATKEVVLVFHDSETFDGPLLCELIEVISLWKDRIPFVFLFAIKTSVELFQEKLSQTAIQHLQGAQFEIAHLDVHSIFEATMASDRHRLFWLGPGLSSLILQAQQESIQSIASFTRSLQYAHMTFFFANPLSILLADSVATGPLQDEIYECVRNLESFRLFAERLLEQGHVDKARRILNDNIFLHAEIMEGIKQGKETLKILIGAVERLYSMQATLRLKTTESWSALYIKAMMRELQDSASVRDTLLAIRKLPSDAMASLLDSLGDSIPELITLKEELRQMVSATGSTESLRSEHDTKHESLRTTVVAQKVELSKHSSSLSKQDLVYSKLVNQVNGVLRDYLHQSLVDPQELFLHEVLVFDLKSPHREVFIPKPRYAIERALTSPRDYLGCGCCTGAHYGLSATHPATSILYQLYLESGAIVNISDLWSAFHTIVGTDNPDDEDAEQERVLYVFCCRL
ncbi:MAG: hypothetical protein LQ352_000291 [Teloschistes flavicans]|nr:MAG: hypothetical protein LQ352_000291 [Teloschistes flavicans]